VLVYRTAGVAGVVGRALTRRRVCLVVLTGIMFVCYLASSATGAPPRLGYAPASVGLAPPNLELARVCPPATSTQAQCLSALDPTSASSPLSVPAGASPAACFIGENEYCGAGLAHGFSPQDLESAYKLPSATAGSGQTVAIVDAYDDPNAQADLSVYRSTYGLPPCESGCFSKVNQTGGTTYPAANAGWALEISLDLAMVSAACPNCHILLVEATSNSLENLGIAENEAATLGATEISNSYAANELLVGKKAVEEDGTKYYTHAGVPMTVASGDNSYDNTNPCVDENEKCLYVAPNFPAGLSTVVAVGGTSLYPEGEAGRGWQESVWFYSGSGCTLYVAKPSWQTDNGCTNRTDNDVAAEASPTTPVSVYDTYATLIPGWQLVGGTSASAPLLAGAIALESATLRSEGSAGIYAHLSNWFDVTGGINYPAPKEKCPSEYLCTGKVGYDGPTGVGTPNGGASATPPSAVTEPASGVTKTGVTLNAVVNPEASVTTYYFQYGASTAYTYSEVPLGGTKASTYTKPAIVSQAITGLQPASVYHYRIVAKSAGGTTYGADRTFSTAPKVYLSKFGSKGTTEGSFESPQGVAMDVHGNVWVSDNLNNRIEEFSPSGTFLKACGSKGSGEGQFNGPTGIAVNPTSDGYRGGYIYVSDSGNGRIEVFSPECKYTETIGKQGSGNGALSNPMGLAFGFDGTHYYRQPPVLAVADSGNNRLEEFTWQVNNAQYKAGEYFASYGSAGSGEGQFLDPTGVALIGTEHPETEQFDIIDSGNNRIQEIEEEEITSTREKASFKHIRQFGSKGAGEGQFSGPTAIATDPTTGELSVTDTGNNSIEQFLPNGTYIARFGNAGSGNESFEAPKGIAVNASGVLYVGDSGNNRIDSWQPSQEAHPQWAITSTPNPSETLDSYLRAVSCATATTCTTVGGYTLNGSAYMPMAERWNGAEWALQTTPNPPGSKTTELYGVSCSSATACIAVGYDQNASGVYLSLPEIWNGTEWKIQTTPEPSGTLNSLLKAVSCTSSTACTAVGWYENSSGIELPWAARWNGTSWSVQSVPVPTGAKMTYPYGVSCTSPTACTMAGYYLNSSGTNLPFAEGWNGTEWSVQTTPIPSGSTRTRASGVSCTSSTACTLVGEYKNSAGVEVTLAERWNGTEWSVQTTPNPTGARGSYLNGGVFCTSSTACTAAGVYQNSAGKYATLAEQGNGTEWKIQTTPNNEKGEGWLSGGISCSSLTMCAAVGNTGKTFAELYR
jgi:hypothetical protein